MFLIIKIFWRAIFPEWRGPGVPEGSPSRLHEHIAARLSVNAIRQYHRKTVPRTTEHIAVRQSNKSDTSGHLWTANGLVGRFARERI